MKNPPITNDELRRAIEAGRQRQAMERRAASIHYDRTRDTIEIELTDGIVIKLPRLMVEEFRDVPPADMVKLQISPVGYGIELDEHDINISVHGLVAALAAPGGMAASLGKLGGSARTEAKRASARANGAKGGRPKKIHRVA